MEIKRINSEERYLAVDLFNQYRVFYQQPSDPALADAYLHQRLQNRESVVFVALEEVDSRPVAVGFTQLYPTYSSVSATKNWILNDLFVEATHRGKGVGEQLVKSALRFAKEDGTTYVQLETGSDNRTAQRLYENIGFTRQQPEENFYTYRIPV